MIIQLVWVQRELLAVPGVPIANGANKTYGAKISKRIPIITEPKQKANHEIKAVIATAHIAKPAIKLNIPTIIFIFLSQHISLEKMYTN